MGVLIGLISIILYYVVVSAFVTADQASVGLLATTYVLVPLVGIPLVTSWVRASFPGASPLAAAKAIGTIGGLLSVTVLGLWLFNRTEQMSPSPRSEVDACAERGVAYFKSIGSYPTLKTAPSIGASAEAIARERCKRSPLAFR